MLHEYQQTISMRMNICSAREYITFPSAQLLRNWLEQRPINKGDIDSSVTRRLEESIYTWVDLILISFVHSSM
jgi:hypothetical protein